MPSFRELKAIRDALEAADKAAARKLLRPLLADPTAEVWILAARACEDDQRAIFCLRKALELEPLNSQANRMLHLLEGARPHNAPPTYLSTPAAPVRGHDLAPLKKVKNQRKRTAWTYIGCVGGILLSLSSTYFVLSVLGSPIIGKITGILTGDAPVEEIEGTPVKDRPDAPLVVTPQQTRELRRGTPSSDSLAAGYSHEYTIDASAGEEIAVMVQFLTPMSTHVSRNVAILKPDGVSGEDVCMRDRILQGDSGVVLVCEIDRTGVWRVRIFGRDGESTGAYVVSVERFQ